LRVQSTRLMLTVLSNISTMRASLTAGFSGRSSNLWSFGSRNVGGSDIRVAKFSANPGDRADVTERRGPLLGKLKRDFNISAQKAGPRKWARCGAVTRQYM
jgi:hypothetical protein